MHTTTTHGAPDTRRGLPPQPCAAARSRFARHRRTTYNLWKASYDTRGRLSQTTDPLGHTRKQDYDADGRPTAEINAAGNRLRAMTYDRDGRLTQTKDGNGNITAYVYGSDGSAPLPSQIRFPTFTRELIYDSRHRNTETRDLLSASVILTTKNTYDKKGNLTQVTDKNGNATQIAYDALSRLTQVTDAAGGITQYNYDARDNLLAVTDPNGNTTAYSYDKNNRRTAETRPLGQTIRYSYNALGSLAQIQDAQGNTLDYSYDAAHRRDQETHTPAGQTSATRTIGYTYNAAGSLTGYSDNNSAAHAVPHSASYTLDALHRKTQETVTYGAHSYTTQTAYQPTGRKASFTWPDGSQAHYGHDANQIWQSLTLASGTLSVNQSQWNAPAKLTWPGGSTRTISYDPLMRLTEIKVNDLGQAPLLKTTYRYDPESNITQKATEHGDYNYQYDSLYRLTRADQPSPLPQEAYSYDKLGNRLSDSTTDNLFSTNTWRYNGNNQLTQHYSKQGQPVANRYDDNGSLVQKQSASADPQHNQSLGYDAQNRLVEVKDNAGNTVATYQYDPYGRRIGKTVHRDSQNQPLAQAQTTYFIYSDEGLIAEADGQGAITTSYGWQPEGTWGTAPVFIKTTAQNQTQAQIYYYQNDHLGTPQQVIDSSGGVVWAAQATAFGETQVSPTSTIRNNLRFAGQYYDEETQTHYNYFRDYAPALGRYIESDPIGLDGGINTYAYALNSPMRYIDPSGLISMLMAMPGLMSPAPYPNGNYSPGFTDQDQKCSYGGEVANGNPCVKACCIAHDACYTKHECNESSWRGNFTLRRQACQRCNDVFFGCVVAAYVKGCPSCP
jgi:RHS repeat-associated protein